MNKDEMITEAFENLVQRNLAMGEKETQARLYAYAGMFGMLSSYINKTEAKQILTISKEW